MLLAKIFSKQSGQIFYVIRVRNGIIFDVLVFFICCLGFVLSWIESSVNLDSRHWGLMYAQALDINRGLIPHKDTLIAYGYLTTWIQSLSLSLFGERLMSIGIMTGIFYSLVIFLSYRFFLKFLPRSLAFFSVCTMFLLHGYVIYPWSNYFSYTFVLLSLLLFFSNKISTKNIFFSGFFLGLSFLCRYSSVPAILPPFFMFLVVNPLMQKEPREKIFHTIFFFVGGFFIPVLLFFLSLIYEGCLSDFFIQNKVIVIAFSRISSISTVLFFPIKLILFKTIIHDGQAGNFRSFLLTINFLFNLLTLLYLYKIAFNRKLSPRENIVLSTCLMTLLGHLNSVHRYDLFRVINGSSIGIGIVAYVLMAAFKIPIPRDERWKKYMKIPVFVSIFLTYIILASTIFFKRNNSALVSWNVNNLVLEGVKTTEISMFRGKILSKNYAAFYHDIYRIISKIGPSYSIVNYTRDPIVAMINDLPRVQLSAFYLPLLAKAYPQESERIQQLIDAKKAIVLSPKDLQIPGYKVIFRQPWPADIPFMKAREHCYISAPETTLLPDLPPSP